MFFFDVERNCRPRSGTAVKIDKVSALCLVDVRVIFFVLIPIIYIIANKLMILEHSIILSLIKVVTENI